MDKEHRFPAAAHGFECRGLVERPTVAPFAQGGGGGNDGEGREAVAHAEFGGKDVAHGGVTTVFDEGAQVIGLSVGAAEHHRGGSAHGDAVHHEAEAVGREAEEARGELCPAEHVETVVPSHADVRAGGAAVVAQIGQEEVGVHRAGIHAPDVIHASRGIAVAVYQQGNSLRGTGGAHVAGVEWRAVGGDDRGVAQGLGTIEAVEPRPQGGNVANHGVACRGFAAIRARLGTNGRAEHEFGRAVEAQKQNDE